jgi:hypothetical protein
VGNGISVADIIRTVSTYPSRAGFKSRQERRERVSLACGGRDTGVREPGICGESLEEVHYRFEEGHSLGELFSAGVLRSLGRISHLGSLRTASWKAGSLKCAISKKALRTVTEVWNQRRVYL